MLIGSSGVKPIVTRLGAAQSYVKQGGIALALTQNLSGEFMAIAVNKNAAALKAELDRVIKQLSDEGAIKKLEEQYLAGTQ